MMMKAMIYKCYHFDNDDYRCVKVHDRDICVYMKREWHGKV